MPKLFHEIRDWNPQCLAFKCQYLVFIKLTSGQKGEGDKTKAGLYWD